MGLGAAAKGEDGAGLGSGARREDCCRGALTGTPSLLTKNCILSCEGLNSVVGNADF